MTIEEKEGAIKLFNTVLFFDKCECTKKEVDKYLKIAIEALEQEPKTGWIPVSERLPEPYENVLRTVKSFGWNCEKKVNIDIGTICPIDTDVLAWMPLPEPYKTKKEEKMGFKMKDKYETGEEFYQDIKKHLIEDGFITTNDKQDPTSPCDVCRHNPPGSGDGKPCTMCPAESEEV